MLMHLVCFKYKTDVDAAARADHRARLATLKSLDGIVDLKVGEDVIRASIVRHRSVHHLRRPGRARDLREGSATRPSRATRNFH